MRQYASLFQAKKGKHPWRRRLERRRDRYPHLNSDPGAIISFPDDTFGLGRFLGKSEWTAPSNSLARG
jgi:hypothetical protein